MFPKREVFPFPRPFFRVVFHRPAANYRCADILRIGRYYRREGRRVLAPDDIVGLA